MIDRLYHWYVVRVKHQHEFKVVRSLLQDNIEAYCPSRKERRQRSDRKVWIEVPWFSQYTFVKSSIREYDRIIRHPSILNFVKCNGNGPDIVNDRVIESLKLLNITEEQFEITCERFRPEQSVEIINGPFKGIEGEVISQHGKWFVLVRISCIQYAVKVHVENLDQCTKLNNSF